MGRTWVLAMAVVLASCSTAEAPPGQVYPPGRNESTFLAVSVTEGSWALCLTCFQIFRVDSPGQFSVEDSEGTETFSLTTEEYQAVLDIVLDSEFLTAVWGGQDDCRSIPDSGVEIGLYWTDREPISDSEAMTCYAQDRPGTHPYARLRWLLVDYKQEYLNCGGSERWACQDI